MEQNNNNDNGAMETIKQVAKNEVNKQKNRLLGKIFLKIAPYLALFLLCLLAIGVIMAGVSLIMNVFKGLLGIDAQAAASTLEESKKMISITSNGYELNDDYADEIVKKLQEQKIDTDVAGFSTDGLSDMIDKYIKAEVKTMYPSIGGSGDVDGLVKIKRMSAETGESKQLTYVSYNTFKDMVANGNTDVLNRFSLNPENFKLCIAVSKTEIHYDYDNGNNQQKSKTTILEGSEIEYQTSLQRYATPLNYFISMHMICDDKQFMTELLEMVDEKTDIELTFLESTYKHFTQVDYEGEITTTEYITQYVCELKSEYKGLTTEELSQISTNIYNEAIESGKTDVEANKLIKDTLYISKLQTTENKGNTVSVNTGNMNQYSDLMEQKQYIIEDTTSQGMLEVTKANTWRLESNLQVQVNGMQKSMIQVNEVTNEKNNIDESNTMIKDKPARGSYRTGWLKEITNEWTESYNISRNETAEGYNITEFIELINKYPNVKDNLESSPSLLFYLLEENENTQELAGLMKYVIYSFTGIDYGVTDLDELFNIQSFNTIGGLFGGSVEEKVWWALLDAGYSKEATAGAMGNIYHESGFRTNNVQDSCEDRVGSDEVYTERVNGGIYNEEIFATDSAGYGLCQWTSSGRKRKLYKYATEKGVSIDDASMQINYLLAELSGKGDAASYATRINRGYIQNEGIIATHDDWKNSTDVNTATLQFMRFYESPASKSSLTSRQEKAQEYYNKFKDCEKPEYECEWSTTGLSCPRYYQSDDAWESYPYNYTSGGTIRSGGCGACALAMAVSGLTRQEVTPLEIVSYLNSIGINTVYNGAGSAKAIAQKYGLTYETISRNNKTDIDQALDSGKCLIFSIVSNGIYTGDGHFIMCNGRNGDMYYVLESARYYETNRGYAFNQVFTAGNQGIFVIGK